MSALGIGEVADLVSTAINKWLPDANIEATSKAEGLKAELTANFQALMGQLEINKIEAASPSLFVSGWRPAVGWFCALGFGYQFLGMQAANGLLVLAGFPPVFTAIDADSLSNLLYGLLGFGGLRTVERFKGVERK